MSAFRIAANVPDPTVENPWMKTLQPDHGFPTQAEWLEAIRDPRYSAPGQAGQHFREYVAALLSQSDFDGNGGHDLTTNEAKAAARKSQVVLDEDKQILREHAQSLFSAPRYSTSALFRRQVRDQIGANPHLADLIVAPNGPSIKSSRLVATEVDYADIKKKIADEKKAEQEINRKEAIERAFVMRSARTWMSPG
jgi:hypothetical protein